MVSASLRYLFHHPWPDGLPAAAHIDHFALALFVIIEAIGLLLNPIALFDLYGWILRVAIGGALVQAINNAAFYKFARAAAKAKT